MIKKLIPDYYFKTINDIPYTKLYEEGYRLILTDLDNTLISYKEKEPTEELFKWKEEVENIGFEKCNRTMKITKRWHYLTIYNIEINYTAGECGLSNISTIK